MTAIISIIATKIIISNMPTIIIIPTWVTDITIIVTMDKKSQVSRILTNLLT